MKKALSIVLAVIMALSAFGVVAFAEGITVSELPTVPAAEDGKIYFAAESVVGAKAGDTVDVPVYLVSNYTTACTNGFVELGFRFTTTGSECTVNSITLSNAVKAINGFKEIKCFYGDPGEGYIPEDFPAFYTDFTGWGFVCFAAGLDILKQDKLQVATINVTIGDKFNEDYDENDLEARSDFVAIELYEYNLADNFEGCWYNGPAVVVNGELTDEAYYGNFGAATPESDEWFDESCYLLAADELQLVDEKGEGQVAFVNGVIMGKEPKATWSSKLIDWLEATIKQIYEKIDVVREFILTIVGALRLI